MPFLQILAACALAVTVVSAADSQPFTDGTINDDLARLKPADIAKVEAALPAQATAVPARPRKLLIYSNTEGWFEGSLVLGAKAIELMGRKTGAWESVQSDDPAEFEPENLKRYDAIFLNQCSRDWFIPGFRKLGGPPGYGPLDREDRQLEAEAKKTTDAAKLAEIAAKRAGVQARREELAAKRRPWEAKDALYKQAFLDFVKSGKGVAATSTAICAHYAWPEYAQVMGITGKGEFVASSVARFDDPQHPLMAAFAGTTSFAYQGQIYAYAAHTPDQAAQARILMSVDLPASKIDLATVNRGRNKNDRFPLSWINTYGQGRVFFNAYGPGNATWQNPVILRHYQDGIQFALGDLTCDTTPNEQALAASAK